MLSLLPFLAACWALRLAVERSSRGRSGLGGARLVSGRCGWRLCFGLCTAKSWLRKMYGRCGGCDDCCVLFWCPCCGLAAVNEMGEQWGLSEKQVSSSGQHAYGEDIGVGGVDGGQHSAAASGSEGLVKDRACLSECFPLKPRIILYKWLHHGVLCRRACQSRPGLGVGRPRSQTIDMQRRILRTLC